MNSPDLPLRRSAPVPPRVRNNSRGSVLMVALILAGVIAISLTSFLQLASTASKLSLRTFYMDEAQNLNDLGLEHALWSMNNGNWTTGTTYSVTLPTSTTTYSFSNNVTGYVKIWADLTDSSKPHIVVKSTVTLTDGSTVDKISEAYIKASSWYDDGMVGNTIDIGSNATLNSYNSVKSDGSIQAYSDSIAGANITVAAINAGSNTLQDSGLIYGSIATGASDSTGYDVTRQGIVGNTTYVNNSANKGTIQDGNATYDFTASFPDVTAPALPSGTSGNYSLPTVNSTVSLPRTTPLDVPASDGNYYYSVTSLSMAGTDQLNITSGNVILVMAGNISMAGQSGINISSGARLKVYTSYNVDIGGNGVMNGTGNSSVSQASQAINFQLYGTRASGGSDQSIAVKGNGYLSGVVYAPNGNVTISGGGSRGDVIGAVVANTVNTNGNVAFHYDESLPNTLTNGLWKLRKWRDLTNASDRSTWESHVTF